MNEELGTVEQQYETLEFPESTKNKIMGIMAQANMLQSNLRLIIDTYLDTTDVTDEDRNLWIFHPSDIMLYKTVDGLEKKTKKNVKSNSTE